MEADSSSDCVISVLIANYNGMGYIEECISSVMSQSVGAEFEIIMHDDASSDGSVGFVRKNFPSVKIIESEVNVGFCVANNRMVEIARGDYLLLLNNDVVLLPGAMKTFLSEEGVPGHSILGLPQYDAMNDNLVDFGCLIDPFFNPVPNLDLSRKDVGMIIGACFWIPRELWDRLGGFPEWFGSIGEDLYLCCKARLSGYSIKVLRESGYRHWGGVSFGGGVVRSSRLETTYRRRSLSERNKLFVMIITCPAPVIYFLVPAHFFLLILECILLMLSKKSARCYFEIYRPVFHALFDCRKELVAERELVMSVSKGHRLGFFRMFSIFPYKLKMLIKYGIPRLS